MRRHGNGRHGTAQCGNAEVARQKVKNSADLDVVWKAIGVEYSEEHGGFMLASSSYRFGFFETLGRSFLYSFKIAGSITREIRNFPLSPAFLPLTARAISVVR